MKKDLTYLADDFREWFDQNIVPIAGDLDQHDLFWNSLNNADTGTFAERLETAKATALMYIDQGCSSF